jgi:hypothetical protein
MIKIFSMLSVMFALLAGFSACGAAKNNGSENPDAEQNDIEKVDAEPMYGVQYSWYNFEISGTVKNEAEEGLENIEIEYTERVTNPSAKTDENGEFVYEFKHIAHEEQGYGLERTISLTLKDDSGIYKEKEKTIDVSCIDITQDSDTDLMLDCKKEGVEIILEKIGGEEPDEYENPDTETDDESTNEG